MEESDKSSPSTPELLSYSPDEEPLELAKKAGKVIWFYFLNNTKDSYLNAITVLSKLHNFLLKTKVLV